MGILDKITEGLKKSSNHIKSNLTDIFTKSKPSEEILKELEDFMISSDMGTGLANRIIENIKKQKYSKEELEKNNFLVILEKEIHQILKPCEKDFFKSKSELKSILICGVNGTGKTTTIGKLCKILTENKKKIIVAAADTFRAAAIEQIETWCNRNNVPLIKSEAGSDPASVVFKALDHAYKNNFEYCIIDTAGRLQNKKNLMEEFSKIIRVAKKINDQHPSEIIIVLDATTGQNALNQIEEFNKFQPLTGIIMTKLDGTAKGGVLLAIAEKYKIPILAVGVGEKEDDLLPFKADDFTKGFLGK